MREEEVVSCCDSQVFKASCSTLAQPSREAAARDDAPAIPAIFSLRGPERHGVPARRVAVSPGVCRVEELELKTGRGKTTVHIIDGGASAATSARLRNLELSKKDTFLHQLRLGKELLHDFIFTAAL